MVTLAPEATKSSSEWRLGWKVLTGAFFGVGTGWATFQIVSGVFIVPMQTDLGWSRSAVTIGPITSLISMLFFLPAGALIDRFGPRRVALTGLMLFGLSLVMMAIVPANYLIFYAVTGFLAIVAAFNNAIVYSRGLATWFKQRFGTAVGLMMTGATVVGAIAIPLLSVIVSGFGWRAGFWALAALVLLLGLPPVFAWFRPRGDDSSKQQRAARLEGHTLREALRDRRFWALILAFGLAALPIGGFLTHLQPLLLSVGYAPAIAASLGSVFVVSIGIGRIVIGGLLDRANPSLVGGGALAFSAAGALLLIYATGGEVSIVWAAVAVAMIGIAQGAESDYLSFFSLRVFGTRSFSRIVAIMSMVATSGMAIGGGIFAILYDQLGSYTLAVQLAASTYLLSALMLGVIKVPSAHAYAERIGLSETVRVS